MDQNNFLALRILFNKCKKDELIDIDFKTFLECCVEKKLVNKKILSLLTSKNTTIYYSKKETYKKSYQSNWLNHVRKVSIENNISWRDALVVAKKTYNK